MSVLRSDCVEVMAGMDYPTAWAFVRDTNPDDHHERCSWRTERGAFLCDCPVLWDEYARRAALRLPR